MEYYYILFTIFVIIACMMVIDANVASAFILILKIIKTKIDEAYLRIVLHPQNPIVNLQKRWEYDKLARELHDELVKSKQMSYNEPVIEEADHEQNLSQH